MAFARRKWLWALLAVFGILLAALAAPFLIPLSRYIPQLTERVSASIGQPVSIKRLRLTLLPTPRLSIVGLKLGRHDEVSIERGSIVPDLLLLLSGEYAVRAIRADGVRIKESALDLLDKLPQGGGGGGVVVQRILLRHVTFEHHVLKLPEFNLTVELSVIPFGTEIRAWTDDGTLKVSFNTRGAGRARVALTGRSVRLPFDAAPLFFDRLEASGVLEGARLVLPEVRGKLYGGTIAGNLDLGWGKQWRIGGKANVAGVQVVPLQSALGKPARLSGRLSGKVSYSARARTGGQLGRALVLDAPFEVAGGEWHGVDLSRVAELPLGKLSSGGSTKFQQMKGDLALRGKHIELNEICVRSPSLVAAGRVAIAPDQKLSGKLDVSVAKTGGFFGVPVALSGTTSDPSLSLTKAGAIGAVIGTVLLPWIGTSLGLSAGSSLEGKSVCK
jgi:uncharacterized protein involved in outer membrane biogenesis